MYSSENRQIVKLVREICKEQDIELKEYSDSWIQQLNKGKKVTYIYGYRFENNSATTMAICNDKVATYMLLDASNIPCIEHFFFMRYKKCDLKQLASQITPYLNKYRTIVSKNNNGTGGRLVYKVDSKRKLNFALKHILKYSKFVAVSPYYPIQREFRCIVCEDRVELIYEKVRPSVIGDGISTLKMLIDSLQYKPKIEKSINLNYVPKNGEVIVLNWKHNLFYGATANISLPNQIKQTLTSLALKSATVLKAKFVSVDIVNIDGNFKVLEVNSGIMMEKFSTFSQENYQKAKDIYTKAILSCLK